MTKRLMIVVVIFFALMIGLSAMLSAQVLPTPTGTPETDAAVTLGMKFKPKQASVVTGIMYYRNFSGTVTGQLWNSSGLQLASVTFGDNSAGWKQENFPPVNVSKDSTYTISYNTSSGIYFSDANYFPQSFPLYEATGSAYRYGAVGFPQASYLNSNYFVEPIIQQIIHDTLYFEKEVIKIDTLYIRDTLAYERNSMFSDSALNVLRFDDGIWNFEFTLGNKKYRFVRNYVWMKEEEINGVWIKE